LQASLQKNNRKHIFRMDRIDHFLWLTNNERITRPFTMICLISIAYFGLYLIGHHYYVENRTFLLYFDMSYKQPGSIWKKGKFNFSHPIWNKSGCPPKESPRLLPMWEVQHIL